MSDLAASSLNDPSGFHLIGFHFIAPGFLGNCLIGLLLSHWQEPTKKGLISKAGPSSPTLSGPIKQMQPLDQFDPLYKHKHDYGPTSLPVPFSKIRNSPGYETDALTPDLSLKNLQISTCVKDLVQNGISLFPIWPCPLLWECAKPLRKVHFHLSVVPTNLDVFLGKG